MNHFDRVAVEQFLNRMSDRMNTKLGRMGGSNLRAAFTDSFELEGANWDKNMLAESSAGGATRSNLTCPT